MIKHMFEGFDNEMEKLAKSYTTSIPLKTEAARRYYKKQQVDIPTSIGGKIAKNIPGINTIRRTMLESGADRNIKKGWAVFQRNSREEYLNELKKYRKLNKMSKKDFDEMVGK